METGLFKRLRTAVVAVEINYVQEPLVETAVVEAGWYDVPPTNNPPIEGQPISFDYKGNPNWYIDLDHSRVEFRVKITKKMEQIWLMVIRLAQSTFSHTQCSVVVQLKYTQLMCRQMTTTMRKRHSCLI